MARPWFLVPIATAVLAAGCATVPTGPSVMVLPGTGKSLEQFRSDEAACRQWAAQQTGTTTGPTSVQRRYDMNYMQCMYTRGNQIPVTKGSQPAYTSPPAPPAPAPTTPANIPPPPAGTPPPPPPGPSR
jgi:hypothetical protein